MALLDHYLRAVRLYLPKDEKADDIVAELAEHLQEKLGDREEELGRALTEIEQEEVLAEYGSPTMVAGRYGGASHGLSFGRQLIGPETFPLYRRILLGQWACTIVVVSIIGLFFEPNALAPMRFLGPMLFQFILSTVIFASIDVFQRRARKREAWSFPPTYLQSIPRWQSISGLVCLSVVAIWWVALPQAPVLVLGSAADRLALSPTWDRFFWPLLLTLLLGIAQRIATLVHPEWNWLQPATRLVTNGLCVAMLVPILRSQPYVIATVPAAEAMARGVNSGMWWNILASFGLYWLINCVFMAWMCAQHVRYAARRRRLAAS